MTDDQIIERWLESQPSPLTREGYAADFERFRQFVGVERDIAEIEMGDIQRYARHLLGYKTAQGKKLHANRQARLLNVVKSFYGFATKHEYLPKNPSLTVKVPKSENALVERLLTRQ
jgi:site-specific recombinase XerD